MEGEPKLRPVPSPAEGELDARSGLPSEPRKYRPPAASVLLAIALLITLALLVWSRIQLGGQIEALKEETRALQAAVAERDRVIGAQRGRLEEVRAHVDRLGALLDEPLPSVE